MRQLLSLLFFFVIAFLIPGGVALAADHSGGGFNLVDLLSGGNVAAYLLIVLAVVELAKRVVAVVPGKPYSAEIGVFEGLLRKVLDLVAGKNGDPADPSLIKRG